MQWMIAFKKSTMKKLKSACLLTFFMLCLVEVGFSQNVRFQSDLIKKDNLWYSGEELYTGEVITLSQDQIETRCSIEKGVPSGLHTRYFWDNTFKKSNYKDTSEVRRLNQEIESENKQLISLINDSLLAYNELISYINNEIGGDKKLQKLVEKKQANKLNEKQKVLMDNFVAKISFWKNLSQNVLISQQKIKLTNTKLKEEEAKPVVAPKIAEQYEQVNSIKNGFFNSFFYDGKPESEGAFLNGLYQGAWTYYYSTGNVKAKGSFVSGDGSDFEFATGLPRNGRDGYWIFYHDNGNIEREANYLNGKLNGGYKYYNNIGVLMEESFYKNGVLDGKLKQYFLSGKLKRIGNYNQGEQNGDEIQYYENGNIEIKVMYKNDKPQGPYIAYFENGKTKMTGNVDTNSLAEGQFIGELLTYNEDGTLKSKIMAYKDGRTEDITPNPVINLSKTEMARVYRCKCCKTNINGILNGVDGNGENASIRLLEYMYAIYSSPEMLDGLNFGSWEAPYKTAYDVFRRREYTFCSMKCSRTCY